MRWRAAIAATILVALLQPAGAATFDLIEGHRFQKWESNKFRNMSDERVFCAAETTNDEGALLRVNIYLDNREAFLELYNPSWSFRQGAVKFSLDFDGDFSAELRGKSWGDSYTYDFLDNSKMLAILGLLIKHRQVTLANSNGERLAIFSLAGASDALTKLATCAGGFE